MLEPQSKADGLYVPPFIDVRSLSRELEDRPELGKLNKCIKRALLQQSCKSDLVRAINCTDALRASRGSLRRSGTIEKASAETALLMSAVMLYARATAGNGGRGERGSVKIAERLDVAIRKDHEDIVAIRNRAIAHVYDGENLAEIIWHEQNLYLVATPTGCVPLSVTRSTQFNEEVLHRLDRLLPIASGIMRQKFLETSAKLVALLKEFSVTTEQLKRHAVDPVDFIGSLTRVREVLASEGRGEAVVL